MPGINRKGMLAGQVAVVTGASRGIGEAIARRFAMEGAKVVVSARTVEAEDHYLPGTITDTVNRINAAGGDAIAVRADLASAADRKGLIDAATKAYGARRHPGQQCRDHLFHSGRGFSGKTLPADDGRAGLGAVRAVAACVARHEGARPRLDPQHFLARGDSPAKRRARPWRHGLWHVQGGARTVHDRAWRRRSTTTGIGVNVISPGLVATPGVMHHKLINESNKERVTPVEHMAEACLRLCHGDPKQITGRIDYADALIKEFGLKPVDLI